MTPAARAAIELDRAEYRAGRDAMRHTMIAEQGEQVIIAACAFINRSCGQIRRQAIARIRDRQEWPAKVESECAAIRAEIARMA